MEKPPADGRIRVRLSTELLDRLMVLATKNGMSLSRMVEHILVEYLMHHTDDARSQNKSDA